MPFDTPTGDPVNSWQKTPRSDDSAVFLFNNALIVSGNNALLAINKTQQRVTNKIIIPVMHIYTYCPVCGSPLTTAEIENRTRKRCPSCQWIHYENPLPVAIAYTVNDDNELLVVRRAHQPGYNEWALPGGFIEAGETPEEGCLRELLEETSLTGTIENLVGAYHRETDLYGSLLVIAYKVVITSNTLRINHELFEADFYQPEKMPTINIPLHKQIIQEAQSHEHLRSLR